LEGSLDRVRLSHALYSSRLAVSYQGDTLYLGDYAGIVSVHVLGKNFLEVNYRSHGDSALETRNTAILTLSRHKICASLVVNSYSESKTSGERSLFKADFHLTQTKDRQYCLLANVHDASNAGDTLIRLQFDVGEKIFYTERKRVEKSLKIFEPGEAERRMQTIHAILPLSMLSDNIYYFYQGNWYIEVMDDNWSKLTG
jgi:hypothetical protein